jgi:hypothetical protein
MCGGTAKTTAWPGGWQGSARCVNDAVSGAGRIYKTLLCTKKIQKCAEVGKGNDHTEFDNRFETLVFISET